MKRIKKPEHMLTGVAIGDFKFEPERMKEEIKKYGDGKIFDYLSMKTIVPSKDNEAITKEFLFEIAEYLRERGIYFTVRSDYRKVTNGEDPMYDRETVKRLQEIAGDYFLGNEILEFGAFYATKARGYRLTKKGGKRPADAYIRNPVQNLDNAKEAKEAYIKEIQKIINPMRNSGTELVSALEAVTLFPYDYEAGVDFCTVEVAPRNMEQIINFSRGAKRAYGSNMLGGWCAHEWYGGYKNDDAIKAKRLKLEYLFSYMAGLDSMCLESGYGDVHTFGDKFPEEHPITQHNLKTTVEFAKFVKRDKRPKGDGPITKVAFVQGNLDGFGWGNSSSLWGQYDVEKWGYAAPEFSYRILDEVYRGCEWHDTKNSGDFDYSASPAWGQYDVIPATAALEAIKRYDYVIFCGWNTMTDEIFENLCEYVKGGGTLLITAAHIRDSAERDKKGKILDADWESFLGCKLSDEIIRTNDGFKFTRTSLVKGMEYPGTDDLFCDPCWSAGYTNYVKISPTGAKVAAYISDSFVSPPERLQPIITEHSYGKGTVIFMASSEYPGAPEIFPLYKIMVKGLLTASHRACEIKVIGSDKIRYAAYDDGKKYKLYILNTDYNFEHHIRVIYKGRSIDKVIGSIELEIVELNK